MHLDIPAERLLQNADEPAAFWASQKNPEPLPPEQRNVVDLEILFDLGDKKAGKRKQTSRAGPSNASAYVNKEGISPEERAQRLAEDGQSSNEGDFDGDELVNAGIEVDEEEDQTVEEERGDGEERVELQDDGVGRGEVARKRLLRRKQPTPDPDPDP